MVTPDQGFDGEHETNSQEILARKRLYVKRTRIWPNGIIGR